MPLNLNSAPSSLDLAGLRVLVADDCSENQYLMNRLLARLGAEVELADDGADAYALALEKDFDIVLLDIQMPILDGYQTIKKLKAANYARPVLAVTASAKDEDRDQILAAGFAARVMKPIDSKILSQTIQHTIALSRSAEDKSV